MIPAWLEDRQELPDGSCHLSFSRLNRYLLCPEQYRLYYVENWRTRQASASLVFGQVVHQALGALFCGKGDPAEFFLKTWKEAAGYDLDYGERESWEKLNASGRALLEKFVREELSRIGHVQASEKPFALRITSLDLPFVGIIDLLAELDGRKTVVDFKTAAAAYQDHEVVLSDQLTAYQLAEPGVEQAALCVFVKTKEPRIEWHLTRRNGRELVEFLAKAGYVAGEIAAERFYKRPGKWCSWCDYLPICTGDTKKTGETLIQVR